VSLIAHRRLSLGVSALVMLGLASAATPAYGAPALTSLEFTDGTTTSDDLTITAGTEASLVVNGSGEGSFDGCWALFSGGETVLAFGGQFNELRADPPVGALTEELTFGVGDSLETVFGIPALAAGRYQLEMRPGPDCLIDDRRVANLAVRVDPAGPATMNLTGAATINGTAAVAATVPGSLLGNDFDLWACPDQTIRPDDNAAEGANGECVGPFIQSRTGDSTTFLLGFDPVRDEGDEDFSREFWTSVCGKFFIVHDFPNGGHSNWIGPVVCAAAVAPSPALPAPGQLAATGATSNTAIAGIAAAFTLLAGGGLLVATRRRHALRTQ